MKHSDIQITNTVDSQSRRPKYISYDWAINLKTNDFYCDNEGQMLMFGEVFSTLSVTELVRLVPLQQRDKVKQAFQKVLATDEDSYLHCCLLTPNSLFTYVEIYLYKVDEYHLKGTISPCLIISSAQEAAEIFNCVFDNPHHGVIVTDSETRVLACNQYFESMTGYLRNELVGVKTNIFNSSNHSAKHYRKLWQSIEEKGYWSGVLLSRHAKGNVFPQRLTIQKIVPGNGEEYFVGFGADLSSELEFIEDIESGGVDLLTQLPTAEYFTNELIRHSSSCDHNKTILVVAIQPNFATEDVTKQKKQFASYLKQKTSAVVCGYLDSNRFLACLPVTIEHPQQIVRDVARTLTTFFHGFKYASKEVYESLKSGLLGVSVYREDADSPSRLISHACQAILELHAGESRRIAFYNRDIHLQIERKKQLEAHVQTALSNKQVEVYFQPIVDVKQKKVSKFEALCRFPPLETEIATTQDYIQVAEDMGIVYHLDNLVCEMAFEQFNSLKSHFADDIQLSVNRSLNCDVALVDILQQTALLLDNTGVSPTNLTIEFTENAVFESNDTSQKAIEMLRNAGVQIAIDDFGSGWASLHYLTKNIFDVLKIDRQFISGLQEETPECHTVQSLIQLAHQLNLQVVAEGVETEQELSILTALGVDFIQGYLFAKPESITQILSKEHYCEWPSVSQTVSNFSLAQLVNKNSRHLDPGDPLSLAFQYFDSSEDDYLAVVDGKKCVGVVSRSNMHLHMTPNMGTDLESNKERANWQKSVNRLMQLIEKPLDMNTPLSEVNRLVTQGMPFPWVLIDESGSFKGLIEIKAAIEFLAQQ